MNRNAVNEAQGLWDSLNVIYGLEGSILEIESSVEEQIQDGASDISFKQLGLLKNANGTVVVRQVLFGDVIIFIINLQTESDYETDKPEVEWEQQLEIQVTTRDLNELLGMASVLQTTSSRFEDMLMTVRMKIPLAQKQTIHYCTFDFGHVWRFGEDKNYLMVIDPAQGKDSVTKVSKFLHNDFPYLITLELFIKKDYEIFLDYQNKLHSMEEQITKHNDDLPKLKAETDTIMLAIHKDHIEELGMEIPHIEANIRKYADQIEMNIMKLNAAIKSLSIINEEIFINELKLFEDYRDYIQKWLKVNNGIFGALSTDILDYSNQVTSIIEDLIPNENDTNQLGDQQSYSTSTTDDSYSFGDSPYKHQKEEYVSGLDLTGDLLDSIPLEWGSSYLLLEKHPHRSFNIFHDLVNSQFMGICIIQEDRELVIDKYNFKESAVYQITQEPGEQNLPPILSKISHLINEFLSENYHSIIYLDGLDYLINFNDFNRVLKFVNNINESIVLNDSIFIMSVNDSAFEPNQLELFLKNSIDISKLDVELEDLL